MMKKMCLPTILILAAIIGAGIYKFIFQGSVVQSADGRLALQLEAAERDLVLTEMRAFLISVQKVTDGILNKDFEKIARSAREVGAAAQGAVPGTLVAKLPLEFKKLGFDTHSRFDQLALDAEQLGDEEQTLKQLSELMQNCVACHAAYRIEVTQQAVP
jgi:mono/diheme cytochrome c family protein